VELIVLCEGEIMHAKHSSENKNENKNKPFSNNLK
jgi:hypothetical protein